MKTQILRGALVAIGFLFAAAMSAQFVSLSRCQAAYPCAFPFAVDAFLPHSGGDIRPQNNPASHAFVPEAVWI